MAKVTWKSEQMEVTVGDKKLTADVKVPKIQIEPGDTGASVMEAFQTVCAKTSLRINEKEHGKTFGQTIACLLYGADLKIRAARRTEFLAENQGPEKAVEKFRSAQMGAFKALVADGMPADEAAAMVGLSADVLAAYKAETEAEVVAAGE